MSRSYTDRISYKLLSILLELAPNPEAQAKATQFYNNTGPVEDDLERSRRMAGVIYDGLAYGNWPWANKPTKEKY